MTVKMTRHNFEIVNGDTDSIAFKKRDGKPFSEDEQAALLAELNAQMSHHIVWKNDKHYRRVIVFKAKNYVLDDGEKVKIKGSALKATKKEPALKRLIVDVIDLLLKDRKEQVLFFYLEKVREIINLTDIGPWCFKATVTKKVLEPTTTFNQKIKDAIGKRAVSEGDKVYLFFNSNDELSLREDFNNNVDKNKLIGKLRKTIEVFGNVFDVELFPDLTLKRNRELFEKLNPTLKLTITSPQPITNQLNNYISYPPPSLITR